MGTRALTAPRRMAGAGTGGDGGRAPGGVRQTPAVGRNFKGLDDKIENTAEELGGKGKEAAVKQPVTGT